MDILDSPPTAELDALARVAKNLFGVRGAAVNLIDHDRQHMKAAHGLERTDAPRSESFCSTTVEEGGFLVIEDTRLDPRFSGYPVVQRGVVFYAGYPVEAPNGQRIGTLCLFDNEPRSFTKADKSLLRELALRVQRELWSNSRVLAR
jgi:GAF domain-containing protein